MAKKRMISLQITDTDAFLDMPVSAQALYFHLLMRADDDGFVDNPKRIMRMIGSQDDDLKVLLSKRFILGFENGVIVIKHWRMQNVIRKDRYIETVYTDEKKLLKIKENGSYTENVIPNGNQMATSGGHSIDKVSLDKDSIDTSLPKSARASVKFPSNNYKQVIENYISLKGIDLQGEEYKPVQQTIKSMFMSKRTPDQIIKCMEALNSSDLDHWQGWNINTVKKQLPLFLAGKLTF